MSGKSDLLLRVHVITWNMNSCLPDESLPDNLLRLPQNQEEERERCIYAIGVQESTSTGLWIDLVLSELGDAFILVGEGNIGGIHLCIFLTKDIVKDYEFDISTDIVSCGLLNLYWNKGAVGFLLTIQGLKLLFVNSHLAAQQEKVKERNDDYHRISNELFKSKAPSLRGPGRVGDGGPTIENVADVIFWFGDFNYRIEGNRKSVEYLLRKRMMNVLVSNDQLLNEKKSRRVFDEYLEGDIHFLPTYKFDNGTDQYDSSSKQRVPSWTDRILWKVCNKEEKESEVVLWLYDSVREMKSSDHKPVVGIFDVHTSLSKASRAKTPSDSSPSLDAILGAKENGVKPKVAVNVPETQSAGEEEEEEEEEDRTLDQQNAIEASLMIEDDIERTLAKEMEQLKEPVQMSHAPSTSTTVADASKLVNDLLDTFSQKINKALDICERVQSQKAENILRKMKSFQTARKQTTKSKDDADLKVQSKSQKGGQKATRDKKEEKGRLSKSNEAEEKNVSTSKVEKSCQTEAENETTKKLYQKISELRTEVYQEKRAHMQTKAKLEIMNRKVNKQNDDDDGKMGPARRKSSISSIATAKVAIAQARMRKKQSQIYG